VPRPDVETGSDAGGFRGAVAEWVLEPHRSSREAMLLVDGLDAHPLSIPPVVPTPYGPLHTETAILGRESIYGSGPPMHIVSDEVLQLARRLPPPILDFGCGAGALLRALRREGIEAYGLELDDERIRQHLLDEVKPYVTVYAGMLPSPFADRQFESVISSEVLEHMPDPKAAVAEMARLSRTRLMITVPDSSSIPRGFAHAVVPWHLLESTHVNFFTQHSLAALLNPLAETLEFSRIGAVQCDRMLYYSSLAAVATLGRRT
jgi:SAM-dependent methyltransferase